MDLQFISNRIATLQMVAKSNPEVAKIIADLIRENIKSKFPANYGYDAKKHGLQEQSEKGFSFPARPKAFDDENLNGTVQVRADYDFPVTESLTEMTNEPLKLEMEAGFYYKTPRMRGGGKYMFSTPSGVIDVKFNEQGIPELVTPSQIDDLVAAMDLVTERVVEEPPYGARSLTRDPREREREREIADKAQEVKREQEQGIKAEQERLADKDSHGSPEIFAAYMEEIGETEFGPADMQKLLSVMFKNPTDRSLMRNEVIGQIRAMGLKWNPGKATVSAMDMLIFADKLERLIEVAEDSLLPIGPIWHNVIASVFSRVRLATDYFVQVDTSGTSKEHVFIVRGADENDRETLEGMGVHVTPVDEYMDYWSNDFCYYDKDAMRNSIEEVAEYRDSDWQDVSISEAIEKIQAILNKIPTRSN